MTSMNNKQIILYLEEYIDELLSYAINNELSITENKDFLFLCTQLLKEENLDKIQFKVETVIKKALNNVKQYPEKYIYSLPMSMVEGIGQYAFSIDTLAKKTNELSQLRDSIFCVLRESLEYFVMHIKNYPIRFISYDLLLGVSGVIYFLLESRKDSIHSKKEDKQIANALKYLIWLTEDYKYKGFDLPRFHIQCQEQFLESERETMKQGHINMGMAHGIIGILLALLSGRESEYLFENQNIAINKILKIYENFFVLDEGIIKFPRRLPIEDFVNGKVSDITENVGWCYGNLGIVRGLMIVAKKMGNINKYNIYKEQLIKIINQPIEKYNLSTSVVCHGYSIRSIFLYVIMITWEIISELELNLK